MPDKTSEERRMHAHRHRDEDQRAIGELTARLRKLEELRELESAAHAALKAELMDELRTIREQTRAQLEIMNAWNDAKGFVRTVQLAGSTLLWAGKVSAVIAAFWLAFVAAVKYSKGGG